MTHVHAPVLRSRQELSAQAENVHPVQLTVRAILMALSAVFVALGWLVGRSWFTVVFIALWSGSRVSWLGACVRYGYHTGAKNKLVSDKE